MSERIKILSHHIGNCLAPFLKNRNPGKVEKIVRNKIIPSMDFEFADGISAYEFLNDPIQKEKYAQALIQAGVAYVSGNYEEIPDWTDDENQNYDLICRSCGNFEDGQCKISSLFDKETSNSPQDKPR